MPTENQVVIVGGGLTGLVAALTLVTDHPGISCVLLEADPTLGGKLRTHTSQGIQVEDGADSFLARRTIATDLCRELGLESELRSPAVFGGLVWLRDRTPRIPRGTVMGVPTSTKAVMRAEALSFAGRARALGDLILPGKLHGNDISVGELVRRRFGPQVLERLVDPILAGTRAGTPDDMSLRAALPQVDRAARRHRSVMAGLRADPDMHRNAPPPFLAPEGGMSRLVDAIAERCADIRIETSTPVARITRGKRGYLVHAEGGERHETTAVVLAVPAYSAATILRDLNESASVGLARLQHASVAVITLTLPRDAVHLPPDSSGFLVPSSEDRLLSAGTWWSRKWPHTTPSTDEVIRCFVGRAGRHPALRRSDDDLVQGAIEEVGLLLGSRLEPTSTRVTRWDRGLPQYEVGHFGRVSRIEGALEKDDGVVLAGADYRGSGIPDCIQQGRIAARRVAAWL